MSKIQELAILLGWDYEKSKNVKQFENDFRKNGVKKQRRVNETFKFIPDANYNKNISKINERIKSFYKDKEVKL